MKKNNYDVIIIGCGIGGLICACYLIKKGLKVLMIEKNKFVGGYVTSFKSNGHVFNTCVRGFVGCGPKGIFDKILKDIFLTTPNLEILRPPVYDEIQFFNKSIAFYNNPEITAEEMIRVFPREKNSIKNFFSLICQENLVNEFYAFRKLSFQRFIDDHFFDKKLKFFLNALRIDSGKSASQTSALADLMLIRGNIIDGGYFPKGGMQSLPDFFKDFIENNGGKILTGIFVKKIVIKDNKAIGVMLPKGNVITSNVVVSNADATFTYCELLKGTGLKQNFLKKIIEMKPSISVYILHLIISKSLKPFLKHRCNSIWNFENTIGDGLVCLLPSVVDSSLASKDSESVSVYFGIPYKDENYWKINGQKISDTFIKRFQRIFPVKDDDITVVKTISPFDLEALTLNRHGATRGWSPLIHQINSLFPSTNTPFKNVFLAGHWVMSLFGNGGIAFAAQAGKRAATFIIKNWKSINYCF